MNLSNQSFNIVLTGFMGTGKSTVGRILAEKLQFPFVDTDAWIEETNGMSIPVIFAERGEGAFRLMEQEAAKTLAQNGGQIVSTGGRMMLDPHNVAVFESNSQIFCLTASAEEIYRRITFDSDGIERPLLRGKDPMQKIISLLEERRPLYGQFYQIETEGKSPDQIAQEILDSLNTPN
ncbi:MAG: shikimate kinase [Chloroflexota bacterium]